MKCPCNPANEYVNCCKVFHDGKPAPTAEKLMRSRYSAYALKMEDYIFKTWHSSSKPAILGLNGDNTKWVGLQVLNKVKGEETDQDGYVEFIASFEQNGKLGVMHETSYFVKEFGAWLYKTEDN